MDSALAYNVNRLREGAIMSQTRPSSDPVEIDASDPLRLHDVDHVRFYCGNAKQAAYFYAWNFGFQVEQYRDLTTGSRDTASYLLRQGNIRLILETGLTTEHEAAQEVATYGDGVKDVSLTVNDAVAAYEQAIRNGAESGYEPIEETDEHGTVVRAAIRSYGRVLHTFVSRKGDYGLNAVRAGGRFGPGWEKVDHFPLNEYNRQNPCGLEFVDHLVGNVELGKMNHWVEWYSEVLGFKLFKHFDDADISTEYTSLMSKVMDSGFGVIKMPINEPAEGRRKSQIEEYLDWHNDTPGVQHLALRTDDELHSVHELRRRGVNFLKVPQSYYDEVWKRVEALGWDVKEDHEKIADLGILVDADDEGYLLQLFTQPLQDRPTLFFEIICRRGSQSFGKGNFKALFEAIEREQARRGNL